MDTGIQILTVDTGIAHLIEQKLLETLRKDLQQSNNDHFVLAAKSDSGELFGGICASTSYGWLLIKTLWVDDKQQRQGLGRRLMSKAEKRGLALGCHSAWLDTSNPVALQFYQAIGYVVFGQLENDSTQYPQSHRRWFMRKKLND